MIQTLSSGEIWLLSSLSNFGSLYNLKRRELQTTEVDLVIHSATKLEFWAIQTHESAIASDDHTGLSLECPAG